MDRIGMRLMVSLLALFVLPGLCAELQVPAGEATRHAPALARVGILVVCTIVVLAVGAIVRASRGGRGAAGRREAEVRRERLAARLPELEVPLHVPPPAPPHDPDPALPWEQP
jgi:hypothetical protein